MFGTRDDELSRELVSAREIGPAAVVAVGCAEADLLTRVCEPPPSRVAIALPFDFIFEVRSR